MEYSWPRYNTGLNLWMLFSPGPWSSDLCCSRIKSTNGSYRRIFNCAQVNTPDPPRCSRINCTLDSPAFTGPWWIWVPAIILSTIKRQKRLLSKLPDCAGFHTVFRPRASFFRRFSPLWSWVDLKAEESRDGLWNFAIWLVSWLRAAFLGTKGNDCL